MESKIFNGMSGRAVYDKRTICEVIKQAYDLTYLGLAKEKPQLMDKITELLEEAYCDGVKMTKKLVENKIAMPNWEMNANAEEVTRLRHLRVHLDKELNRCDKLKLALITDPNDYKLSIKSYSKTYYDMANALYERFGQVKIISKSQSAKDINADVIIFFDVHGTHHITIDGIEKHPAVKYSYFNDLHQGESRGIYPNGQQFHKLGPKRRAERAVKRGIQYIITPSAWGYHKYIAPFLGKQAEEMMLWFPPVPKQPKLFTPLIKDRRYILTCQGHMWKGVEGFRPYEFRRWVSQQKDVIYFPHVVINPTMPIREAYINMLTKFKGAVAACEYYPVAKYFEIPIAGCVTFAQKCEDFERLNMKDGVHCLIVNKDNFNKTKEDFIHHSEDYQKIATEGQKLVQENWTAECFANYIYNHAKEAA